MKKPLFTLSALLWLALPALAQNYSIDWYVVSGGGGASSGGAYSVSGTIGQADTALLTGGNYALQGGFWSLTTAIPTEGAPLITISRTNNAVVISWPASATGFVLQQTASLAGPSPTWTAIPSAQYQTAGTNLTFTVTASAGNQYFRLQAP